MAADTSSASSTPDDPTFDADYWADNPDLLGTSRYAVAGALSAGTRNNFTQAQAQAQVDKFAKREVKAVPAQPDNEEG